MVRWRNLAIRSKLLVLFGVLFLASGGLGLLGLGQTARVNDAAGDIRNNWLPSTVALGKLAMAAEQFRIRTSRLLIGIVSFDASNQEKDIAALDDGAAAINKLRQAYQPLITAGTDDERLIHAFDAAWGTLQQDTKQLVEMDKQYDRDHALALFVGATSTTFDQMVGVLESDMAFKEAEGRKAADHGARVYAEARWMTLGALAATALICLLGGLAIGVGVVRPISRTTQVVDRLAAGDLSVAMTDTDRGDEIGVMARALGVFKDKQIAANTAAAARAEEEQAKARRAEKLEGSGARVRGESRLPGECAGRCVHRNASHGADHVGDGGADDGSGRRRGERGGGGEFGVQTVAAASEELAASIRTSAGRSRSPRKSPRRPSPTPAAPTRWSARWPATPKRSAT